MGFVDKYQTLPAFKSEYYTLKKYKVRVISEQQLNVDILHLICLLSASVSRDGRDEKLSSSL